MEILIRKIKIKEKSHLQVIESGMHSGMCSETRSKMQLSALQMLLKFGSDTQKRVAIKKVQCLEVGGSQKRIRCLMQHQA
jgi:hypothetical protein